MRRARALLMTALVFLFFAEAHRAFVASLLWQVVATMEPGFGPGAALLALIMVAALAIPLVPVARFVDRTGAVVLATVAVALFRLPMTDPSPMARSVGSSLALACAGAYMVSAVGHVDRRALGAGAVLGLVADQLLRLAGAGHDVSLRPGWLPIQAALSLGLVAAAVMWARDPRPDTGPEELERRGGGLRLRGGIALAALLFLDLTVLSAPIARVGGAGTPDEMAAAAVAVAAGLGLVTAFRLRPLRGRTATLALAAAATVGSLAAYLGAGIWVIGAASVGHLAALVLVPRALDPASGRRSGRVVVGVLALLVALAAAHSVALRPAHPAIPALSPPWVLLAAGILAAGSLALLPRAAATPPIGGWGPALAAGALVPVITLLLLRGLGTRAAVDRPERRPVESATTGLPIDDARGKDGGTPAPLATLQDGSPRIR